MADHREFGRAIIDISADCALFDKVWKKGEQRQVWMSHGDRVISLPAGFHTVAHTTAAPFAAIADETRRYYGVQFHPEVMHTPDGAKLLQNFVRRTYAAAAATGLWRHSGLLEIARIRKQVGDKKVLCATSGGVDSSVVAGLLHEAIGDQVICIFIDTGLLRQGEAEQGRSAV